MKISTAFPSVRSLPDPTSIVTPAQWYLLAHVSSPLIQYDHARARFEPLLAESWRIDGSTYTFKLRGDLKFSDGTPLTARDVASTIRRQILKNTSTHFRLRDYFRDCAKLASMTDACPGLSILDDHTIAFHLPKRFESFFLFLASPESAVWSADDIDASGELSHRRFSGPYRIATSEPGRLLLEKNTHSYLLKDFPRAPAQIEIFTAGSDPLALFREKKIDLYVEMVRPHYEQDFLKLGLERVTSSFNTILYLFKVGGAPGRIGRDYVQALWHSQLGPEMKPAGSFLPLGSLGALDDEKFLAALPARSTRVKVAVPTPFFHPEMTAFFDRVAREKNAEVKLIPVPMEQIYALYDATPENPDGYDFVLTPYVASERFPSVQITFMLEGKTIPLNLANIDDPDSSPERVAQIEAAQKWLLESQTVVPLVFVRNQVLLAPGIDLGDQPQTDAEIHLWRVQRN